MVEKDSLGARFMSWLFPFKRIESVGVMAGKLRAE